MFWVVNLIFIVFAMLATGGIISMYFLHKSEFNLISMITISMVMSFLTVPVLFMLNIILQGVIFGSSLMLPLLLSAILLASFVIAYLKRLRHLTFPKFPSCLGNLDPYYMILTILVVITVIIDGYPLRDKWFGGDYSRHLGWANQLLIGKTLPYRFYKGMPTDYPWLFSATLAFMSRLTSVPPTEAYMYLTLIQVVLTPLSAFILTNEITKNKSASLFASFFVSLSGPMDIMKIILGGYEGPPLMNYFPISAIMNVAPVYPRDLAIPFFLTFLCVLHRAISAEKTRLYVYCGLLMGITSLLHDILFIFMCALLLVLVIISRVRVRLLVTALSAIPLISLYYIPFLLDWIRLGTTPQGVLMTEYVFSALDIVYVFGFSIPFGIYGVWLLRERIPIGKIGLLLSIGFTSFSTGNWLHSLPGYLSITFRLHRWLHILYLFLSIFSAYGLSELFYSIRKRRKLPAVLILLLVLISGILSTYGYSKSIEELYSKPGYVEIYRTIEDPNNIVSVLKEVITKDDVLLAPPRMSEIIWSLTGVDVVYVNNTRSIWLSFGTIVPQEQRRIDVERVYQGNLSSVYLSELLSKYEVTIFVCEAKEDAMLGKSYELIAHGTWIDKKSYSIYRVR